MKNSPPLHPSEPLDRDSAVDALRGLAALSVLMFHARGVFWIGFVNAYHQFGLHPDVNACIGYLSEPFSYGFLGVNLFFVLSGYCIHRRGALMLAKNPDARLNLGSFALRRFWRIYPTYVAALSVTALVDWWIASRLPAPRPDQVDSVATFIVSLFTLQGYLAPYFGDNGVFWTLAIEVHLYIAYPILFYLTRHHGPQKTVLFTLAVACSYLLADRLFGIQNHLPYRAVQGPVFLPYWFTWAMGFYVAELEAHRAKDFSNRTWIVLMVLGFVLGLPPILHGTHPTFDDLFWAVFFAGFLRWSISPAGERFWSHWYGVSLAAVGVFSYSLYAIHAPVLDVIHILLVPGDTGKFVTLWPTIGAVLIAVLCAWLFFQLVERWSIRPARTVPVNSTERKSHG